MGLIPGYTDEEVIALWLSEEAECEDEEVIYSSSDEEEENDDEEADEE